MLSHPSSKDHPVSIDLHGARDAPSMAFLEERICLSLPESGGYVRVQRNPADGSKLHFLASLLGVADHRVSEAQMGVVSCPGCLSPDHRVSLCLGGGALVGLLLRLHTPRKGYPVRLRRSAGHCLLDLGWGGLQRWLGLPQADVSLGTVGVDHAAVTENGEQATEDCTEQPLIRQAATTALTGIRYKAGS